MTRTSSENPDGPGDLTAVAEPTSNPGGSVLDAGFGAPPRLSPEGYNPESLQKVKVRGKLLRLMSSIFFANIGIFTLWGAIPGILLPLQIQGIDPESKAANLAVVTTVGAFAAMIAQPVAGTVSDRTRSRFGRRAPWMVLGAIIGGLSLIGMSLANGVAQLTIAWVCVQISYNFAQGPLSAIMPDRVPRSVRGTFAALSGLGLMVGSLGGQIVGAQFAGAVGAGYVFFAGLSVVLIALFVVFNPDHSNNEEVRPPFSLAAFLKTFWVNPIAHPDFFWAFIGRLLLFVGYFLVIGYQLYILQDYIGMEDGATAFVPVLGLISLAAMLVSTVMSGPISDRIGRRKIVVIIAGVILSIALLIPWMVPTATGMMVFAFVSGLGFGSFQAIDTALMSEVLPSQADFGKDLGVLNIAATLPQTIAPAIAGVIVLSFGSYAALFPIGVVIVLVGAFAVIPIKSVR